MADRYGAALTRDLKGERRTIGPVQTPEEAKELCEIATATAEELTMWIVEQRDPAGEWSIIRATVDEREAAENLARLYKDHNPKLRRMNTACLSTVASR